MSDESCVWLAQCLCPSRHCIAATAAEADSLGAATPDVLDPLRVAVAKLLRSGAINPWCGLCRAEAATWRYEIGRTRFRTMAEAAPELKAMEAEQAIVRAIMPGAAGRA